MSDIFVFFLQQMLGAASRQLLLFRTRSRRRVLRHDGVRRQFLEYLPSGGGGSSGTTRTAVMVLHGFSRTMQSIVRNRGTRRWLDLSDQHGFLVLAPNAYKRRDGWNDLRNLTTADGVDDVGFLTALAEWARVERGVETLFVTGASNGGMMTYTLLLERPEIVDAAAVFIANLAEGDFDAAATPTPLFLMHGSKDPLHKPEGGVIGRDRGVARSARDTLGFWLQSNQVNASAVTYSTVPDETPNDDCTIEIETYEDGTAPVIYYTMVGGGHVYPIEGVDRSGWLQRRLLGPPCGDTYGVDLAWDFLSSFVP